MCVCVSVPMCACIASVFLREIVAEDSIHFKRCSQAERKCTFSCSQGWGIGGDQLES